MHENSVDIELHSLLELVELKGRYEAFKDYVRKNKYAPVERITCAAILGFDLEGNDGIRMGE